MTNHPVLTGIAVAIVLLVLGLRWLWRWAIRNPNADADYALRASGSPTEDLKRSSEDPRHPMNR